MQTTTNAGPGTDSDSVDGARECARLTSRLLDGRMFWDLWFSLALLPWTFTPRVSASPAAGVATCDSSPCNAFDGPFEATFDRAPLRRGGSRCGNVVYVDFR